MIYIDLSEFDLIIDFFIFSLVSVYVVWGSSGYIYLQYMSIGMYMYTTTTYLSDIICIVNKPLLSMSVQYCSS